MSVRASRSPCATSAAIQIRRRTKIQKKTETHLSVASSLSICNQSSWKGAGIHVLDVVCGRG